MQTMHASHSYVNYVRYAIRTNNIFLISAFRLQGTEFQCLLFELRCAMFSSFYRGARSLGHALEDRSFEQLRRLDLSEARPEAAQLQ